MRAQGAMRLVLSYLIDRIEKIDLIDRIEVIGGMSFKLLVISYEL